VQRAVDRADDLAVAHSTLAMTVAGAVQVEGVVGRPRGIDDAHFLRVAGVAEGAEQSPLRGVLSAGERLAQEESEGCRRAVATAGEGRAVGVAGGGSIKQVSQVVRAARGAQPVDAGAEVAERTLEGAAVVVDEKR